ncbi:macro domain-containing protein [Salmonella enterica]|nr:macro domain-containing protein [Salmonella enterica]
MTACRAHIRCYGNLPAGTAIHTPPGKLPCRGVNHEVGPRWLFGVYAERQDGLLAQAYHRALTLARDSGFFSLAFPCISTGHYFIRMNGKPASRYVPSSHFWQIPRRRWMCTVSASADGISLFTDAYRKNATIPF